MPYPPNTRKFRELMDRHGISPKEAGEMLGRKTRTIYNWRGAYPQVIPDAMLELFELKLALRSKEGQLQ